MKRTILTATLLFQGIVSAQDAETSQVPDQPIQQAQLFRTADIVGLGFGRNWYDLGFAPPQQSNAASRKSSSAPSSADAPRPRTEGSMIGYIENAIVGSQIRIRSDAGFGSQYPDRAEFFYSKCGCYKSNLAGSGLPAWDPNAPGPGPGVVTKLNFQQLYMQAEYSPHRRFSMFVEVPVRWIQPTEFVPGFGSFGNQAGLGDITAGFKAALVASEKQYLTVQLKGYFPSGDASKGLGTSHYSIEPSVLFYQSLSPRAAIEGEFGIWHPIGGSAGVVSASTPSPSSFAGNVLFYGIGPSYQLIRRDRIRFAPVVEMVGWSVRGGYQTVWVSATQIGDPSSGTNILNLKVGARTELAHGNSFYVGYGRALTNDIWYSNLVRVEFRHSF